MKLVAVLTLTLLIAACSTQTAYELIQESRRAECHKLQDRQREECLIGHRFSYGEYKHTLGAVASEVA